ncbi:MAG: NAD(P)H-dependent oxidoreductase [Chitinophagaceae bacterium]
MNYTIISGTGRQDSHTFKVSELYLELLSEKGINANLFSLHQYKTIERTPEFLLAQTKLLIPAEKFIIISPEYNGSYPGVLKSMIDISDTRNVWNGKKVLLTGVSSGRAGNLRGMDHLTGVLNYMKCIVHPNKLPISVIDKLTDSSGKINDVETLLAIDLQLVEFISF